MDSKKNVLCNGLLIILIACFRRSIRPKSSGFQSVFNPLNPFKSAFYFFCLVIQKYDIILVL